MTVRPIVRFGDPRLRTRGERVTRFDRHLGTVIDDMIETMRDAPGAGLAAQQIGLALQLCVIEVDGRTYELANPRIVHLSDETEDAWEGCLSLPGFRALRSRAARAVVEGQDRTGRKIRISGRSELARAIQHEYDHLQGELYVDGLPAGAEIITEEELDARIEERQRRAEASGSERRPELGQA